MSKFTLEAQTVQIIKTADGKEFNDMAQAQAHQTYLENKEVIDAHTESFLNDNELIDRNRKQKAGVAGTVIGWLVANGADLSGVAAVERRVEDSPAPEVVEAPATEGEETPASEEAPASEEGGDKDLF